MNVPATLKHSFLLCLFAAAVPLWAIPAPMQVTAATPGMAGRIRHGQWKAAHPLFRRFSEGNRRPQ